MGPQPVWTGAGYFVQAALGPGQDTRYPLHRRLGGPTASLDGCGIFRAPAGFDPRTVQSVDSRYTGPHKFTTGKDKTKVIDTLISGGGDREGRIF